MQVPSDVLKAQWATIQTFHRITRERRAETGSREQTRAEVLFSFTTANLTLEEYRNFNAMVEAGIDYWLDTPFSVRELR